MNANTNACKRQTTNYDMWVDNFIVILRQPSQPLKCYDTNNKTVNKCLHDF